MLEVYQRLLAVLPRVRKVVLQVSKQDRNLADQMQRAGVNAALNLGEGMRRRGGNKRLRYETAAGEAGELLTGLEVAAAFDFWRSDPALLAEVDRIVATLYRLSGP